LILLFLIKELHIPSITKEWYFKGICRWNAGQVGCLAEGLLEKTGFMVKAVGKL
jgi:hypothetical protein